MEDIKNLMSERSQETKKFSSIILKPTQEELESIHNLIKVFPNLVSIDYIPNKFLPQLAELLGYNFLETEDVEVQREILKRLIHEYHQKGLYSTIMKIATRGYSENFFLGDLTFYHGYIDEGYASITYPRDHLFRYDHSKWDGSDRWPDMTEWRDGVVQIDISVPTDPSARVQQYLDENLPAGLKYYISILRDVPGDLGLLDMAYKLIEDTYEQYVIMAESDILPPYVIPEDFSEYDNSTWDSKKYYDHQYISVDNWEEKKPQAAIHRVFYPIDSGYTVAEVWDEPFIDNWYRYCGIIDGTK